MTKVMCITKKRQNKSSALHFIFQLNLFFSSAVRLSFESSANSILLLCIGVRLQSVT